jgi:hypothetical protein
MDFKDLQFLKEATDKVLALKKFAERESDLGDPSQFEILYKDVEFPKHQAEIYAVCFKAKDDYYEARYNFWWKYEGWNPDHLIKLLTLKRYADENYDYVEAEITPGSKLFIDAEEKIEALVDAGKLEPEIPPHFWKPDY